MRCLRIIILYEDEVFKEMVVSDNIVIHHI